MTAATRTDDLARVVGAVLDPELGDVTIGELGLVVEVRANPDGSVEVDLVPTFLGCPALGVIAADVQRACERLGATSSTIRWRPDVRWTTDRVSAAGVAKLAAFGVAVDTGHTHVTDAHCPDCSQPSLEPRGDVGPTACRSIAWCIECRSPVEILRGPSRRHAATAGA